MNFSADQLDLLIYCAVEPIQLFLVDRKNLSIETYLFSADIPGFYGLTKKEYLKLSEKDYSRAVLPQDLSLFQKAVKQIFSGKGTETCIETCTYRACHKTKGIFLIHAVLKWIGDFKDKHVLIEVFSNVSYPKAENILGGSAESQEQFQASLKALILANPQSLCTVRLNLSLDKCVEWYGTSSFVIGTIRADTAEGVIANISKIIINEHDRDKFLRHFGRKALLESYKNGQSRDIVRYRRTIEDGSAIWVETVVNMIENPDSHEIEAVLFSENVDNQVLNEEIIQRNADAGYEYIATLYLPKQEFQFRYLGDFLPDKYKKMYNGAKSSMPFKQIIEYAENTWLHPDELDNFRREASIDHISEQLGKFGNYTITLKSRKQDKTEGWKQLKLAWLDETQNWILIQQADISEAVQRQQKELIDRLNLEKALRYEADKANESKTDFISNVSHDMRTPLNAILGYDRLALETDSNEKRTDYLEKIGEAGETLLALINDTLDLQKIENGVITLHPSPVPCSTIVKGIITAIRPLMDAKGIYFTFDNSKAVWATVNVDAVRVEEIFINLLSNAAKFTPKGGKVSLSVECEKEIAGEIYDKLTVKDNGIGISEKFLSKIYEPFAQERNEKTAMIGGSGLGLSIVKRLVDLMHGRIEVKSRMGEGTEFTVYLTFPKAGITENQKASAEYEQTIILKGKKVLLCEDNMMNREIATAILEKNGMIIEPAVNGKDGVEKFMESKHGEIAAVLMDIRMPVMDGYEASMAIRSLQRPDSKTVPIIALSADVYSDDIKKAEECGMTSHLSKPIDSALLLKTLQKNIKNAKINAS